MSHGSAPERVAGLPIPIELTDAIRDGRWRAPRDFALLRQVFGDEPVQPRFYSMKGIVSETEHWRGQIDQTSLEWYLGEPSAASPPGDISQVESVLIGDLGPDRPIALDYRPSFEDPEVIYLTSYNGWVRVAPTMASLLELLGLTG